MRMGEVFQARKQTASQQANRSERRFQNHSFWRTPSASNFDGGSNVHSRGAIAPFVRRYPARPAFVQLIFRGPARQLSDSFVVSTHRLWREAHRAVQLYSSLLRPAGAPRTPVFTNWAWISRANERASTWSSRRSSSSVGVLRFRCLSVSATHL